MKFYTLKKPVPMEPWQMGFPVNNLEISSRLLLQGHPKKGDMIAVIDGKNILMSAAEFSRYQEVAKPEKGESREEADTDEAVEKGRD